MSQPAKNPLRWLAFFFFVIAAAPSAFDAIKELLSSENKVPGLAVAAADFAAGLTTPIALTVIGLGFATLFTGYHMRKQTERAKSAQAGKEK